MPTRLCSEPRCPDPVVYRGRCQRHAKQRNTETTSPNKQLYNSKHWKVVRRAKLSRTPICERCDNQLATDVHHVTPLQQGGKPWAFDNLESLCHSCHSRETRREQGAI